LYLFFDTETTGVPRAHGAPPDAIRQWPRLVQIAWAAYDEAGSCVAEVPPSATKIHGISTARAKADGQPLGWILERFLQAAAENGRMLVGHNVAFDRGIVAAEMYRLGYARESVENGFYATRHLCLMIATAAFCRLPRRFGKPK